MVNLELGGRVVDRATLVQVRAILDSAIERKHPLFTPEHFGVLSGAIVLADYANETIKFLVPGKGQFVFRTHDRKALASLLALVEAKIQRLDQEKSKCN